jgi:putative ABC transport system permease protein
VSGGQGSSHTLLESDADTIKQKIDNVNAVSPELSGRYQVIAKGTNTNTSVVGVIDTYPKVRNLEVEEGDFITSQNLKNFSKVAVLGPTARDDLFGADASAVGKTIKIKNILFTVIGVTKAKGGSGFSNPDDMIFVPLGSAQRFLVGDTYVSSISIQAANSESMTQVQADITSLLLERHKISDPELADFRIFNQADILATASSITDTFTITT